MDLAQNSSTGTLGDRMKSLEHTSKVLPFQAFIVRADGNRFSKYTQGLHKPIDVVFQRAMVRTANSLRDHFHAATAFVCSDEISLVFSPACSQTEFKQAEDSKDPNLPAHIFSGRHNKIETLVSSKCSVMFNKFMAEEVAVKLQQSADSYAQSFVDKVNSREAIFDARLIPLPLGMEFEIVNNLIWRSCYDCHRNTVAAYARDLLGSKVCQNKNSTQMIEIMKEHSGFDFVREVPMADKYGVFCKKSMCVLMNQDCKEYMRYRYFNFCINLLELDRDQSLEMMLKKYFVGVSFEYEEYTLD